MNQIEFKEYFASLSQQEKEEFAYKSMANPIKLDGQWFDVDGKEYYLYRNEHFITREWREECLSQYAQEQWLINHDHSECLRVADHPNAQKQIQHYKDLVIRNAHRRNVKDKS